MMELRQKNTASLWVKLTVEKLLNEITEFFELEHLVTLKQVCKTMIGVIGAPLVLWGISLTVFSLFQ